MGRGAIQHQTQGAALPVLQHVDHGSVEVGVDEFWRGHEQLTHSR